MTLLDVVAAAAVTCSVRHRRRSYAESLVQHWRQRRSDLMVMGHPKHDTQTQPDAAVHHAMVSALVRLADSKGDWENAIYALLDHERPNLPVRSRDVGTAMLSAAKHRRWVDAMRLFYRLRPSAVGEPPSETASRSVESLSEIGLRACTRGAPWWSVLHFVGSHFASEPCDRRQNLTAATSSGLIIAVSRLRHARCLDDALTRRDGQPASKHYTCSDVPLMDSDFADFLSLVSRCDPTFDEFTSSSVIRSIAEARISHQPPPSTSLPPRSTSLHLGPGNEDSENVSRQVSTAGRDLPFGAATAPSLVVAPKRVLPSLCGGHDKQAVRYRKERAKALALTWPFSTMGGAACQGAVAAAAPDSLRSRSAASVTPPSLCSPLGFLSTCVHRASVGSIRRLEAVTAHAGDDCSQRLLTTLRLMAAPFSTMLAAALASGKLRGRQGGHRLGVHDVVIVDTNILLNAVLGKQFDAQVERWFLGTDPTACVIVPFVVLSELAGLLRTRDDRWSLQREAEFADVITVCRRGHSATADDHMEEAFLELRPPTSALETCSPVGTAATNTAGAGRWSNHAWMRLCRLLTLPGWSVMTFAQEFSLRQSADWLSADSAVSKVFDTYRAAKETARRPEGGLAPNWRGDRAIACVALAVIDELHRSVSSGSERPRVVVATRDAQFKQQCAALDIIVVSDVLPCRSLSAT